MLIKNGLLGLPGQDELLRRDLRLRGEAIAEIGPALEPEPGEELLDAQGLLVLPGGIDPHVHFDEPGFTRREDFLHGTSEAAKGGVTTVIDMPCTSLPPVTGAAAFDHKLAAVSPTAVVDFAFHGGVEGRTVEASLAGGMAELASRGVVGFKCYFISGMPSFTRLDPGQFARAAAEAERLGRPLLLHAEDFDIVNAATARLAAVRGGRPAAWSDYAESRPAAAELAACRRALDLAKGRESTLHVVHVSTAAAAELLCAGGASAETCAHYLAFTGADFARLGAALKTAPPVKSAADREGLWMALASGVVSFLASDHAPAPAEEKNTGDPLSAYGGIPGVGTGLPYLLSEGLLGRRLGLARFLELSSGAAARRFGLAARKGSLEPGKDADFALIDPEAYWRVEGGRFFSKGRITPFEGMRLKGRVLATFVRGKQVFRRSRSADEAEPGEIVATAGHGRFLAWGYR